MQKLAVIIAVLFMVPFASAYDFFNVTISANPLETEVNKFASSELSITNKMGFEEGFRVSLEGPNLHWRQPAGMLLDIGNGQSKATSLQFTPTDSGFYPYTITVTPVTFPDLAQTFDFGLNVTPPVISIVDLRTEVSDNAYIHADISTSQPVTLEIHIAVKNRDTGEQKTTTVFRKISGVETFTYQFSKSELYAGTNDVQVSVAGSSAIDEFYIEPVHDVHVQTRVTPGILYDEIVVEATNNGNVVEKGFEVDQQLPSGIATGFVTKPSQQSGSGATFVIGEIMPHQTKSVIYRSLYGIAVVQIVVVALLIGGAGFFFYTRESKPRITKRRVKKAPGTHSIVLEIRNPHKHLTNVLVRDFVTPLAHVSGFQSSPPQVKKSDAGTELIWKLGKLKPKEQIYLSYDVRPLVIGSLKMPKAYVRWGNEGKLEHSYSDHVSLD